MSDPHTDAKQVKVLQLINAYRFRGHQNARLDPLDLWNRETVAELDPAFHNLTGADLDATFNVGSYAIGTETMKLKDLVTALKKPTAAPWVRNTCTSPAPRKSAGFRAGLSLWWVNLSTAPKTNNASSTA
ncbi:hypothetical protein MBH78_23595 [Oceanimonas sp. NS1]|nr:hypothetical protein [Oceanimonas sp. NS1]